jgi:hypothetical protein
MTKTAALIKELEQMPDPLLDEIMAFVQLIKHKHAESIETTRLSEPSLAKEWSTQEEDEAWQDL